jgi:hypothetical protein
MVSPKEMYVFARCVHRSCVSSGGCVVHLLAQEMVCCCYAVEEWFVSVQFTR